MSLLYILKLPCFPSQALSILVNLIMPDDQISPLPLNIELISFFHTVWTTKRNKPEIDLEKKSFVPAANVHVTNKPLNLEW